VKLLINTTTLIGTGVTQVAVSFINECRKNSENTYIVLLSSVVKAEISVNDFPENFTFYCFDEYPQRLFKGFKVRNFLKNLEKELKPDIVFSVFGPSYWTPLSPHLQGYAYPHYVYEESPYFKIISLKKLFVNKIYKIIHRFFLNRNGKFFVSETEDVSKRAIEFLGIKSNKMFTVNNTYSEYFNSFEPSSNKLLPDKKINEFRLLSLCSFAPHKNLEILNKVVPQLEKQLKIKFTFVLTVDEKEFQDKLTNEAKKSIINLGRIDVSICPQLYFEIDALFLPTLLECFSANYPEAMKMRKPILTSNISFARAIAGNAAIYFNPLNHQDISSKIIELANNYNLQNKIINEGVKRLSIFNTADERAKAYLEICKTILNEN
jgi:glycosyltransferase involved in cell wall biosynthesis